MTDRELLQQALAALCVSSEPKSGHRRNELQLTPKLHIELYMEAIEAIRTRLAQPEMINGLTEKETNETMSVKGLTQPEHDWKDVSDAQLIEEVRRRGFKIKNAEIQNKEWVSLTDEEYQAIRYGYDENGERNVEYELFDEGEYGMEVNIYVDDFARAIEAKLKEKNGG